MEKAGSQPSYFNLKSSLFIGETETRVFLDVDNKDRVQNFKMEPLPAGFDDQALTEALRDQSVNSVLQLEEEDVWDDEVSFEQGLLLFFIKRVLVDYQGGEGGKGEGVEYQKGFDSSDLICRCFGIYGPEIRAFFAKNPNGALKELGAKTLAGCGCTSCWADIEKILVDVRTNTPEIEIKIDQQQLEELSRHMKLFLSFSKRLEDHLRWDVLQLNERVGVLEIEASDPELELSAVSVSLKDFLGQKMKRNWTIVF